MLTALRRLGRRPRRVRVKLMPKRAREPVSPLRIPLDFDEAVKALLGTPPPPKETPGTRTAKKAKKQKAKKR